MPHDSTLCYAEQRLLQQGGFGQLQRRAFRRARLRDLIGARSAAVNGTGLDSRHASRPYVRRNQSRHFRDKPETAATDGSTGSTGDSFHLGNGNVTTSPVAADRYAARSTSVARAASATLISLSWLASRQSRK